MIECSQNCWNALQISSECSLSAVWIPPEVWLEGTSNAAQIHLEYSQNPPGMADEYGSNIQEFKQNVAQKRRMYYECFVHQ